MDFSLHCFYHCVLLVLFWYFNIIHSAANICIYFYLKENAYFCAKHLQAIIGVNMSSQSHKTWAESAEEELAAGTENTAVVKILNEIKLAGDFVGEAAIDTLHCSGQGDAIVSDADGSSKSN